jgi:hypothetical protein
VFAGSLGDWAFHAKLYYPEVHGSSHNYLCHRCLASRTIDRLRFYDVSSEAGWRHTSITTDMFMAALPEDANPIFRIQGFGLALIRCDFMHCAFLGIFLVTCGNIAWELAELGHFGAFPTVALRLDAAFMSLKAYMRRHGLAVNLRGFSPHTFNSPSASDKRGPELHAKAHDCRVILGWLAVAAETAPDIGTLHGKRRYSLAWCQRDLCQILEAAPRYMVEPHLSNFTARARMFLDLYLAFAEEFRGTGRWHCIRKVHTFAHLIDDVGLDKLNPRFYSGWTDETLMHHVVVMSSGKDSRTVSETVLRCWWPMFVQQQNNVHCTPCSPRSRVLSD